MTPTKGARVGKYEIQSLVGEGGMGRVYRALDTELGRPVALKFLPEEFAADPRRMSRFEQEARAVSALNHPNILTVYEIGRADSSRFLATEFVGGVTLREHAAARRLGLGEVLDIGVQVAGALSAAHAEGVVHRDIKPENVMVRPDGYVKVLDFGIAKLAERAPSRVDTEAATRPLVNTDPGAVMGTAAYMSPEQARGLETDARTDIWSLGVVLYELLTGRQPFAGATVIDTIAAVVGSEPAPLRALAPDAPEALQEVVADALAKDREARPSARQLLARLERLRRRVESGAHLDQSLAPDGAAAAVSPAGPAATTTSAAGGATAPAAPSATDPPARPRRPGRLLLGVALLALALAGGGYAAYRWAAGRGKPVSFESAKFSRLTSTGKVVGVSLSPDGKYVAHVVDDGGQQSLWVRQTAAPSDVQVVPPAAGASYRGFSFSPDGNFVYYTMSGRDDRRGTLYQVPVLGGASKKLLTGINSGVTFSPDGRQLAFFRRTYAEGGREDSLLVANADGTGERTLAKGEREVRLYRGPNFSSPAWSPDGKTIACPYGNTAENYSAVAAVSVESGELKVLTSRKWFAVRQVEWLADGDGLLFTAQENSAGAPYQLWHLSHATGEVRRVTNDLSNYRMFSLTAKSDVMAVVQGDSESNIWVMPAGDPAGATQVTFDKSSHAQLTWTHDGRIVYSSTSGGGVDLYLMDQGGGGRKQLTAGPGSNGQPQVTRDGRYVVFMSDRTGRPNIWRMDLDGGNQTRLTDGADLYPHVSPDGRWVVYQSWVGNNRLRKVSVEGGQPVQLTDYITGSPAFSPDGGRIACAIQESASSTLINIAVLSSEGGQPLKKFPLPGEGESSSNVLRWTPDGREIVYGYLDKGVTNLWAQPVDGGPPRQLTSFTSDRIFWFDFSHDGRQIALSRGSVTGDVVLIRDFR